jgi:hypothetical protein
MAPKRPAGGFNSQRNVWFLCFVAVIRKPPEETGKLQYDRCEPLHCSVFKEPFQATDCFGHELITLRELLVISSGQPASFCFFLNLPPGRFSITSPYITADRR